MYRYFIQYSADEEEYIEQGLTAAPNYHEAAANVLKYYGSGLDSIVIFDFRIYPCDSILNEEELHDFLYEDPGTFFE